MTLDSAGRARSSIAIVGFMASGKTTIGQHLASRLGLPFVDIDRQIEIVFDLPIKQIFERHGEAAFRAAERAMIARSIDSEPKVISLGGGAYDDPSTRIALRDQTITIWLDPPFELILERLARSSERPLAAGKSSDELRRLWLERRRHYGHAHRRVVTGADCEEAVAQILNALA